MKILGSISRIDLDKPIKDAFEEMDRHTDCTFFDLSKKAQEIANDYIAICENANHLTRLLDSCLEFRHEIGCEDLDIYPQETDVVQRYYRYLNEGKQV